jgi:hypothetical protein
MRTSRKIIVGKLTLEAKPDIELSTERELEYALGGLLKEQNKKSDVKWIKDCLHDTEHALFTVGGSTAVEEGWVSVVDHLSD